MRTPQSLLFGAAVRVPSMLRSACSPQRVAIRSQPMRTGTERSLRPRVMVVLTTLTNYGFTPVLEVQPRPLWILSTSNTALLSLGIHTYHFKHEEQQPAWDSAFWLCPASPRWQGDAPVLLCQDVIFLPPRSRQEGIWNHSATLTGAPKAFVASRKKRQRGSERKTECVRMAKLSWIRVN